MAIEVADLLHVGTLAEIETQGCTPVTGAGHTIAVFAHGGMVYALDNRCPHMGFPLTQGTAQDGILTCHWHHARFDLASGDPFDLFAGDIPRFEVVIEDGEVYVDPSLPQTDAASAWAKRLDEALKHDIRLVVARSVIGMMTAAADYRAPLTQAPPLCGVTNSRQGWDSAMTILTICANIQPWLLADDRPRAMYQGVLQVADQTAGRPPRFMVASLSGGAGGAARVTEWFRGFVNVRDAGAAERTLRTAIESDMSQTEVASMIFAAITEHLYVDGGHTIDFANKAFELLDHIGWEHASPILTALVPTMVSASHSEESSQWRNPVDVSSLVFAARSSLANALASGAGKRWDAEGPLVDLLLGDDPALAIDGMTRALADGATPEQLGAAVTQAAFARMARYHLSNEFGDWNTVHHGVTTANAVHQALRRAPSADLLRAAFDTAMAVYHARFLNIPPAAISEPNGAASVSPDEMLTEIVGLMDQQQHVNEAGRATARYVDAGMPDDALLATLAQALLREDAGFHQFQLIEAALQQYALRRGTPEGRLVLIAAARFLAAHTPTVRSVGQTYNTAFRLHRGDNIFQDDE